jgi:hypothetical protein
VRSRASCFNCIYIHTNVTTCSVTQSQCPMLLFIFFYYFRNLFFKTLMYQSAAYCIGWLRLKGK